MNEVIYIGHCVPEKSIDRRIYTAAANAVIWYISDTIHEMGYPITLYSACFGDVGIANGKYQKIKIDNNFNLVMLPFVKYTNKLTRLISHVIFNIIRFIYLFLVIKKKSVVIVYHSVELMNIIKILKKVKKIKLIIEVGEIYGDYWQKPYITNKEINYFKIANAYIFQSEKLESLVNTDKKPYVINYGSYNVSNINNKLNKEKIHCIYSGTFNPKKGGVEIAIQTALYLSENYVIHICGSGTPKYINDVKKTIENINKISKCKIIYEGLLDKVKYEELLSKCIWGLSTQNPNASFNDTCFPSKILMYLGHGLNVISSRIPVVINSDIGKYLTYYNEQDPKDVANAIQNSNISKDNINIVKKLDNSFREKIQNIINDL